MTVTFAPAPSVANLLAAGSMIRSEPNRMIPHKGEVTVLLERLAEGDRSAEQDLMPQVYMELHRLAMARLKSERPGHTLQATALVHEAYLRLCRSDGVKCQNRAHFFRIAARLMRRILVDYARQHGAQKRNDGAMALPLDEALSVSVSQASEALEVDDVLEKLAAISPRQAQVVEMRVFAGLNENEIAIALDLSVRTIRRDWLMARAWLHSNLKRS